MSDLPYTQLDAAPLVADDNKKSPCSRLYYWLAGLAYFSLAAVGYYAVSTHAFPYVPGDGANEWEDGFAPVLIFLLLAFLVALFNVTHVYLFTIHSVGAATLGVGVQITVTKWFTMYFSRDTGIPMTDIFSVFLWLVVSILVAIVDICVINWVVKKLAALRLPDPKVALPNAGIAAGLAVGLIQGCLQFYFRHGSLPYPFAAGGAFTPSLAFVFHTFWNTPLLMLLGWMIGASLAQGTVDFVRTGGVSKIKRNIKNFFLPVCVRALANVFAVAFVMRHKLWPNNDDSEPLAQ
eukprot:GDKI01042943.1.p1 GENE.GDKI01042943.1~~GDKI01042943.1.p1  ORF type:complete len:292 (+),score=91.42 GDKI01042943.1:178-1053(+)